MKTLMKMMMLVAVLGMLYAPTAEGRSKTVKRPLIQMAILLDTSSSMDGLINQAKSQLWKVVNEFISSKKQGQRPELQVALYEYGNSNLSRYSHRPVPAIHIIVDHGNVTLEGAVGSELDKTVAFMLANQVHGVFQVTNNLIVDRAS